MTDSTLTPGKRDPEARRRAIVDAALDVIVQDGPDRLTHRAVARRAGVSLGSTTQYFSSLDELREEALALLSDEIDRELVQLDAMVCEVSDIPGRLADEIMSFFGDTRSVNADVALFVSGLTDPRLRELALRWPNRLIEVLTDHVGQARATAIAEYLDGALLHTALRGAHLTREQIATAIRALAGLPERPDPGDAARPAPPPTASARGSSTP